MSRGVVALLLAGRSGAAQRLDQLGQALWQGLTPDEQRQCGAANGLLLAATGPTRRDAELALRASCMGEAMSLAKQLEAAADPAAEIWCLASGESYALYWPIGLETGVTTSIQLYSAEPAQPLKRALAWLAGGRLALGANAGGGTGHRQIAGPLGPQ